MRLSELLNSQVVSERGETLGPVRDVRVRQEERGFRVTGLVIGGGALAWPAHAWGYAEGRAQGPWLLRALTRPATRVARFVPAERVADWGPGEVRVTGEPSALPPLREVGRD